MKDTELIGLLRKDPEQGLGKLMDDYMGLVVTVVRGRLDGVCPQEDIEECVSSAFAEFYLVLDSFDPARGTVKALLCSIAKHLAANRYIKKLRENARITDEQAETAATAGPGADEKLVSDEERRAVINAVDALPEPDRGIIIRKYYLHEDSKHIARSLRMTVSAVDTRAHRAVKRLRMALEGLFDE